jgi:hypothetical protein
MGSSPEREWRGRRSREGEGRLLSWREGTRGRHGGSRMRRDLVLYCCSCELLYRVVSERKKQTRKRKKEERRKGKKRKGRKKCGNFSKLENFLWDK